VRGIRDVYRVDKGIFVITEPCNSIVQPMSRRTGIPGSLGFCSERILFEESETFFKLLCTQLGPSNIADSSSIHRTGLFHLRVYSL